MGFQNAIRDGRRSGGILLLIALAGTLLLTGSVSSGQTIRVYAFVDCPQLYMFQGSVYEDYSTASGARLLTIGNRLGIAHEFPCESGNPSQRPPSSFTYVDEPVTVYRFREIPTESAVAVDTGGKHLKLFVTRTKEGRINPEIRGFLKEIRSRQPSPEIRAPTLGP
jgi:hypothetical protein